ncbi:MAG: hypothetical protein HY660_01765, partial [Armatimonadetes bacterium]|nr:hypothetical protein [Armatimonadota bacterium]
VNIAIDLMTSVRLDPIPSGVEILSEDMGLGARADSWEALVPGGPLDLVIRTVRFCGANGVRVVTASAAPPGSGLGASSSLLVALLAALLRRQGLAVTTERLVDLAARLEAQSIRVPTGKQDYYAACGGGVNAIWFRVAGDTVEPLPATRDFLEALESRLLLAFTGQAHFSGSPNWQTMRAYLDGVEETVGAMRRIKEIALAMYEALWHGDLERFTVLLGEEWAHRRRLAPGVSTLFVERLMAAAAACGARASKLCGAGGGGCMVTVVEEGSRERVAAALAAEGATVLPFQIARRGLRVHVKRGRSP